MNSSNGNFDYNQTFSREFVFSLPFSPFFGIDQTESTASTTRKRKSTWEDEGMTFCRDNLNFYNVS